MRLYFMLWEFSVFWEVFVSRNENCSEICFYQSRSTRLHAYLFSQHLKRIALIPRCLFYWVVQTCESTGISVIKFICCRKLNIVIFAGDNGIVDTIVFLSLSNNFSMDVITQSLVILIKYDISCYYYMYYSCTLLLESQ